MINLFPAISILFAWYVVPFILSLYAHGFVVQIPRLPHEVSRIFSTLLVLNARSTRSVVPTKLDATDVPEFHATVHGITAPPDGVCQLAIPVASDINIFPTHGFHHAILIVPFISNLAVGELVQIPILHPEP